MRISIVMIFSLALLPSCKDVTTIAKKDYSDNIASMKRYHYKYADNKLSFTKEIFYILDQHKILDEIVTETSYEYNSKGLISKKTELIRKEDTIRHYFYYDEKDSLIRNLSINCDEDTILWEEYKPNRNIYNIIFRRQLYLPFKFDPSQANTPVDTSLFYIKCDYDDGLCKTIKYFDKYNKLSKFEKYEYANNTIIKKSYCSVLDLKDYLSREELYDYSKSLKFPDIYYVNLENDTIGFKIHNIKNNTINSSQCTYDFKNFATSYFEKGKLVKIIRKNSSRNDKTTKLFDYYDNGNLKETREYDEEIKAD